MDEKSINVCMQGHDYTYELGDILGVFFSRDRLSMKKETFLPGEGFSVLSRLYGHGDELTAEAQLYINGKIISAFKINRKEKDVPEEWDEKKAGKHLVKYSVFEAVRKYSGKRQPWGILTGIRPAKIAYELIEQGMDDKQIAIKLKRMYSVEEDKSNLICKVARIEKQVLAKTSPESISIYIGIPFCPTRCLYCSFTSNPLSKSSCKVQPYLEALALEIDAVGKMVKEKGWDVQSIYIGGGTPTSISEQQLDRLLQKVADNFAPAKFPTAADDKTFMSAKEKNFASAKFPTAASADDLTPTIVGEFTLEAGRPDTITEEKLRTAKKYGVNRISINPQTMNEEILKNIGRAHTPEQTVEAFGLARTCGFTNINMDIIAGLPGESTEQFENTLKRIRELGPDSLTVHTLAVKRASQLKDHLQEYNLAYPENVAEMLGNAAEYAKEMGMHPYYLYRQKNMLENLENIGYSRPGCESIYNIQIMEEKQTILAIGADGVTKLVFPKENRIERIFNVKNVDEYINRVEEMIERKRIELFN